jgi:hypothetical protein
VDYLREMTAEIDEGGEDWPPFAAGVFGTSFPDLVQSRDRYHAYITQNHGRFMP